jgi:hypothetical protein
VDGKNFTNPMFGCRAISICGESVAVPKYWRQCGVWFCYLQEDDGLWRYDFSAKVIHRLHAWGVLGLATGGWCSPYSLFCFQEQLLLETRTVAESFAVPILFSHL